MIEPTVGRVVWFYRYVAGQGYKGPLAAHIAKVHSPSMVNLMVIGEDGTPRSESSVPLVQDNCEVPQMSYCEWMPYQKGQAAKTEALESKLAKTAVAILLLFAFAVPAYAQERTVYEQLAALEAVTKRTRTGLP